ncbi:Maf family protein, partial [Klebsiella pneumoniae]|uniref:Maf family protein n=1 Tax=Klebsiella pneumoniae TaxID=573 RepID=UPI0025A0E7FD
MLSSLSGRTHEVFTGVTIIDAACGKSLTQVVRTGVSFRELSPREIDEYVATGEPMDKAGAYAIQ